ncbi:MAG: O-antigen ligase family protein [Bryobacterales bacterium]|nr:O-antigen ligase family protein [Bryobacterales bacterium]
MILLPLMVYLGGTRGWFARLALLGTACIFLAAIFVTFSRGGLVGLVAALGIYAWRKRSVWFQAMLVAAIVGGLAFGAQYWSRQQDFSQLTQDVSFQQRIATSKAGIEMFIDHPLLGVGIACSVVAWPLYAPHDLYTRGALITHNTVIQALSETGILGFIPFVLFIGAGIVHARRLTRSEDEATANMGAAIEASLWGLVVCGMSGGYILTWFPYLLLGLAGAARRVAETREEIDDTY